MTSSRRGRGKAAKSIALIDASYKILAEIQPATVRAVCYRLFTAGLTSDMKRNTVGKVGKQLGYARDRGLIPWSWIVDEHRTLERASSWDDLGKIIDCAVNTYRRDNWQSQPNWVEVWSEKGTVRGTLAPILDKYGVGFRVQHGFSSKTVMHDVAEQTRYSEKSLKILYVGDYDPSGMYMSEADIPQRLIQYNGRATLDRIALTGADVAKDEFGKEKLPGFPAEDKRKDPRYQWFVSRYGFRCWELDALSPPILRQRTENAILQLLDIDAWNRALLIEKAEIDAFKHYRTGWKQSISTLVAKYSESMETRT